MSVVFTAQQLQDAHHGPRAYQNLGPHAQGLQPWKHCAFETCWLSGMPW